MQQLKEQIAPLPGLAGVISRQNGQNLTLLALESRRHRAKGSRELKRSRGKSAEQLHSCTSPAELVPARPAPRTRRPG